MLVLAVLLAGLYLRCVGLTRGLSDFVLPEQPLAGEGTAFYHFHPDETLLIRSALALENPLEPPLTSYGMVPLYLLRGALEAVHLAMGWELTPPAPGASTYRLVLVARVLAVAISFLSLWLTYTLSRQCRGIPTSALALLLVATVPLAVQQAHYYTVDGPFLLTVLIFFHVALRALRCGRLEWYALAGATVGVAGAVRLNGLVLGLVVFAGHCLWAGGPGRSKQVARRLRSPHVWVSGGTALAALALLEPYLVFDLHRVLDSTGHNFASALRIATGEQLTLWNLADVHTLPYWHYWSNLLPSSVGWPLSLAFAAGLIFSLRRPDRPLVLMLLWCGCHFLLVGGLQTKHVRYLLPLLPFLSIFAASLFTQSWRRISGPAGAAAVRVVICLTVAHAVVFGIAFSRIYGVEDSRIQAGRWIAAHVPKGSRIGVEKGAFTMGGLISSADYKLELLGMEMPFHTRGYLTCRGTSYFLQDHLHDLDYLVITDANRYAQFTAVPEMFPVVAGFYRRLEKGKLDFEAIRRFKQYPQLLGLRFEDDGAEPSFLGYDHPAAIVFKRSNRKDLDDIFARWREELLEDPHCADQQLRQAVTHLRAEEFDRAQAVLQEVSKNHPNTRISHFLAAKIHHLQGEKDRQAAAERRYTEDLPLHRSHLAPWASSISLMELGLPDYAVDALKHGVKEIGRHNASARRQMAGYYVSMARNFAYLQQNERAAEVFRLAKLIDPEREEALPGPLPGLEAGTR